MRDASSAGSTGWSLIFTPAVLNTFRSIIFFAWNRPIMMLCIR
jgi:hypothetical protein